MSFEPVWDVPGGHNTLIDDSAVEVHYRGGEGLFLRFRYAGANGEWITGGVVFRRVRSYRWAATSHLESNTFEGRRIFNSLSVSDASDWLAELHAFAIAKGRDIFTFRHFIIYLDDWGLLEVAAESVSILAPGE